MHEIDKIVQYLTDYFFKKDNTEDKAQNPLFSDDELRIKNYIEELEEDHKLDSLFQDYAAVKQYTKDRQPKAYQQILKETSQSSKPFYQKRIFQYGLAASFLLFLIAGQTWRYFKPFPDQEATEVKLIQVAKSFKPGKEQTMIRLDDGTLIPLDASSSEIWVSDDVKYNNGKTVIQDKKEMEQALYMTLQVPRGGEYKLKLADGTLVYLNAESSIRYPRQFKGNNREVYLSGEAYFDVEKDASHPFIIHTEKDKIEVLGTSFNVKAYKNELQRLVTLVHGSVQVINDKKQIHILKPGQQSVSSSENSIVRNVQIEDYTGWKNGYFDLNNEDLTATMQQLGRWYNLDIKVSDSAKDLKLWGSLGRYDSFDKVIDILRIIDKNITVKIHNRRVDIMK